MTDGSQPSATMDMAGSFGMVQAELDGTQSHGLGLFNWNVEGWYGGDINKLWIKSEGLTRGDQADDGEVQALWSRNISDFWDFQAGVREDFAPTGRTYAAFGFEGLAPYFFETQVHMFVSDRGDVSARVKQSLDLPVTQHLFVEPHLEANFSAQNVPDEHIGSGLSDVTLGLQTRYEITREFAPYVDFVWMHALGNTANYLRANAEPPDELTLRAGIRLWF